MLAPFGRCARLAGFKSARLRHTCSPWRAHATRCSSICSRQKAPGAGF